MKIPLIRQILVVVSSVALVSIVMIRFDDILNVAITPLPPAAKECLQARLSNDVAAQATCSVSATDALSAWTSDGKLRETKIFEDWATGKVTLTGTEGIRLENTATKYGFINSEAAMHVSQNTFYNGTAWKRITTGRTGGFQTNTSGSEALRVFSDDTSAANTVDPTNTPRFIVRTDGDIIVNGTSGFGDARMSFNNTNGNNDSIMVMRGGTNNNGPVYSIMPWNTEVYLSSGVYYSNGAWVHASPGTTSQLLSMQPGTGVRWYTSNNSSVSWNVAPGTTLWNESGQWTSSVTGNVSGTLTGPIDSTSKGTITRSGNSMSTSNDSNLELYSGDPDGAGPAGPGAPFISFHRPGVYGAHFGLDTDNWFSTKGWSPGANGYAGMRVGNLNAKGRIYPENWIEFSEYEGLYSTLNGAYFYPNNGSYGSWRVAGSRNNWYGLEFDTNAGQTSLMMGNTGNTLGNQQIGAHNNSWGWLWYFSHRNLYAEGLWDIANTGYYVDPAGTSNINTLVGANYYTGYNGVTRLRMSGNILWTETSNGTAGYNLELQYNGSSFGGVRIGGDRAGGGSLTVNGPVTASNVSDIRLKKDVKDLENPLEKLTRLHGVTYRWKDPASRETQYGVTEYGTYEGFIAQELEKEFPEWVETNNDGFKVIKDSHITRNGIPALIIEAVKELNARFESFRKDVLAKLASLQDRQSKQEQLIQQQEEQIKALEERVRKLESSVDEN